MLSEASISTFRTSLRGASFAPGESGYDAARVVFNRMIDRRPALIAKCSGAADVIACVGFAREHHLPVAVRGGGHSIAGKAICDDGLMIDLSAMKGVRVDPAARTVRAEPGLTIGEFDRETQAFGLATTMGVISTTGIAGLTLGGGIGWLMGKHALALDNLLSVDLVLADGRVVTASADQNADLFWGLCGGGGNFGVATSFEYRLHPVGPTITGGVIAYPLDAAWDVLRHFRDITASLPDELMVFGGLIYAPDGSGTKLAAMVVCHCGSLADGEVAVRNIRSFGAPVMDAIGPLSYCQMNSMLDDGYPRGALNYWKSSFLSSLSDEAIRTMIDCFTQCPAPMGQLLLEHFHGAVTRVGTTHTAFPHRAEGYNLLVLSQWLDPKDNDACVRWARNSYDAMQPFAGAGRYVNYLGDDEQGDAIAAAYGPNYRRLQQIKAKYDPENVFRLNQNIRPAT